jgi:hypothetical protein
MNQQSLKEMLDYNPETGVFLWRLPHKNARVIVGDIVGGVSSTGFWSMTLNNTHYQAHKLAWLYMTGDYPSSVEHINGNKLDNRWTNLDVVREVPEGVTTQELLKEFFSYDKETGLFTRLKTTSKVAKRGSIAGGVTKAGYIIIAVGKNRHYAHRLAWLYETGELPINQIDHINHNKSDNRFCNLREATASQNSCNIISKRNNAGIKGVTLNAHGKFHAQIMKEGVLYQDTFKTLEEARAFLAGLREELHGEFARH